ncbi:MAG: tetrathionate reductase family octaheme c-type cytochrome [Planctomycetota bacterium]
MSNRYHFVSATLPAVLLVGLIGGCPPQVDPGQDARAPVEKPLHEKIFTDVLARPFNGPGDCLTCHGEAARQLLGTGHWQWQGASVNITGHETETHGKRDLINNFCIAVPSNEGRCSQCHPSFNWKNKSFDFNSTANIDCLVCHDTTNTYRKHPSANGGGGPPSMMIDGTDTLVGADALQEVAYQVGPPNRKNCGFCHFYAGGGDNVKHPDLSSDMANPPPEQDVHMGALDFKCQTCHTSAGHGIAGMALHSVNEGAAPPDCARCHGERPHRNNPALASALNMHTDRVACETCHIPAFARGTKPTKLEWYWSEAGQTIDPIPTDEYGKPTYDKMKGRFVWGKSVRPTYMWYNGKWERRAIHASDTYTNAGTPADPIVMARPLGSKDDPTAKVHPFKRFIGDQPVDPILKRLLVPHLFGLAGGPNPYWAKYDWGAALADGAAYAGQPYSGTYGFAHTVMYLHVSHEVAPAAQALRCEACHGVPGFFEALGYPRDPFEGF